MALLRGIELLLLSADDVEDYFTLLQGESGGGANGLVGAAQIMRAARELQLDVDSAKGFSEENVEKMIECFDQGGKGVLSLGDFKSVMRQILR